VASGLPAALKAAGLSPTTIGYAPTPGSLQDIEDGKITAGLGVDFPVALWMAVDVAARLVLGEALTPGEQAGSAPEQLLEQKDITFDPSKGWTGYRLTWLARRSASEQYPLMRSAPTPGRIPPGSTFSAR